MNLLHDFAKNILFLFYSLTKLKKIDLAHFLRDLEKHQRHGFDLVECNLRKKWMTVGMCFDLKQVIRCLGAPFKFYRPQKRLYFNFFQFLHNFTKWQALITTQAKY